MATPQMNIPAAMLFDPVTFLIATSIVAKNDPEETPFTMVARTPFLLSRILFTGLSGSLLAMLSS